MHVSRLSPDAPDLDPGASKPPRAVTQMESVVAGKALCREVAETAGSSDQAVDLQDAVSPPSEPLTAEPERGKPAVAVTRRKMRRGWYEGIGVAWRDLLHDRKTTVVLIITVAAIIAPVLLLFGLKNGIVSVMIGDLLKDPRTLQVTVYGNTNLDRAWFERYRARPDVAFIVPRTRTLSATIDLANKSGRLETVELIPTAPGDPLLTGDLRAPARPTRLLVTATLADKLGLRLGDPVTGIVRRGSGGNRQNALLDLEVSGIIPEDRFAGDAVFSHLDLLVAAEDFRDNRRETLTTESLGASPGAERAVFANARVYATDLDGVATVAAAMRADGIEIRTEAEKIRSVRALADTLQFVFRVIAVIGTAGGILALGGALWVNIDRKRRSLALLRLYGFGSLTVVLVPLTQSLTIAAGGLLLAYGGYLAGASVFNGVLGANLANPAYVCLLGPEHLRHAVLVTLAVALVAASAAGYRASRVNAAECLREG